MIAGPVLAGLVAAVMAAGPAWSQTAPQVGVPGCQDDVPVRATRELITFDSRGRSIRAHLYSPRTAPNGQGLILLHGGTGFEMNAILFDAHAIQLASRGYHVLLPAYFDAGEPNPSRRVVTARAWRQAAVDAANALEAEPGIRRGDVALWGYSRGASVAVDAATGPGGRGGRMILVAGGGDATEGLNGRPLSALLLHARRDEAVPVRATLQLADDLRDLGATVDVQTLNFDGHQYDLPTWCVVMTRTRAFLEEGSAAAAGVSQDGQ